MPTPHGLLFFELPLVTFVDFHSTKMMEAEVRTGGRCLYHLGRSSVAVPKEVSMAAASVQTRSFCLVLKNLHVVVGFEQ